MCPPDKEFLGSPKSAWVGGHGCQKNMKPLALKQHKSISSIPSKINIKPHTKGLLLTSVSITQCPAFNKKLQGMMKDKRKYTLKRKQVLEPDSAMMQILKLSDREFKI